MEKFKQDDFDETDEAQFAEFDKLIEHIRGLPAHGLSMLNIERVRDVKATYGIVKKAMLDAGCDANVKFGYGGLTESFAYVEIEGNSVQFMDMESLSMAAKLANNIEVYTLVNGNVRMTFGFNDLLILL